MYLYIIRMYLIPWSFLSLNLEILGFYILFVLELGMLLPPNLQILAHYL